MHARMTNNSEILLVIHNTVTGMNAIAVFVGFLFWVCHIADMPWCTLIPSPTKITQLIHLYNTRVY